MRLCKDGEGPVKLQKKKNINSQLQQSVEAEKVKTGFKIQT
jgi:hypothetical protein